MPVSAERADAVRDMFRRAAEAQLDTPGRSGACVRLRGDEVDELVIAADLHGHRLNYQSVLRIADLDSHPRRHLVLQEVCHGGPAYPRGGCMSHLLLEDVAALKLRHPARVHFLLSNHELAEALDLPITKGNRMLNLQFRIGLETHYGPEGERVREEAMRFVRAAPLALRVDNGLFVSHSAPEGVAEEGFDNRVFERTLEEADLSPGGLAFRVVWGRDFRESNAAAWAKSLGATALVHGHEPCAAGVRAPNRWQVIVDSSHNRGCCLIADTRRPASVDALLAGARRL